MADTKISALPSATTPLTGTEVLPIVQGAANFKVSVADLTTGRALSATAITLTSGTANGVAYLNGSKVLTTGSALKWDLTTLTATGSGSAGEVAIRTGDTASNTSYLTFGTTNYNRAQISVSGSALTEGYMAFTTFTGGSGAEAMRLTSSGLEVKQSQLIGYSSYAGIGTNGLAVAGNVGIGTSSPATKLNVGAGGVLRLNRSDNATYGDISYGGAGIGLLFNDANSEGYSFRFGGTDKMRLDSSGNLGLGVTPVATWGATYKAVQVGLGGSLVGRTNAQSQTILGANWYVDTGNKFIGAGYASQYQQDAGAHYWSTSTISGAAAGDPITFTQAMTLDASGNLGVGTTSPVSKLQSVSAVSALTSNAGFSSLPVTVSDSTALAADTGGGINFNAIITAGGVYNSIAAIKAGRSIATGFDYRGYLSFYTGSNATGYPLENMRLDSSGNLGLGVTPSANWTSSGSQKALQVGSYAALSSSGTGAGGYYQTVLGMNCVDHTSSTKYINTGFATAYVQNTGEHVWYNAPSGTAGNSVSFTQAMTLDASGNLGIGTSSPQRKFSIANGGPVVEIDPAGIGSANPIYFNYNRTTSVYTTPQYWALAHNWMVSGGTSAMLLDSSGNLGLGGGAISGWANSRVIQTDPTFSAISTDTASDGNFSLSWNAYATAADTWKYRNTGLAANRYRIAQGSYQWFRSTSAQVAGTDPVFEQAMTLDASGNLLVGQTTTGFSNTTSFAFTAGAGYVNHINGTSSGSYYAAYGYNGGVIGSITQNGVSQVLYNIASDQRLKENIQDAAPASALIDSLQVRQYNWKSDGSHQRYGFVAQELVTVAPEAVHQPVNSEEMMAVDYSKLVPMLVKEIQDLRKRLAAAGI